MEHLGELISRRLDSSVYTAVKSEVLHAGPYIAWQRGVKHATLESYQAEMISYLTTQKTRVRVRRGDGGGANPAEVAVNVARRFREASRMVHRTDVELSTACRISLQMKTVCVMTGINLLKIASAIAVRLIRLSRRMRFWRLKTTD